MTMLEKTDFRGTSVAGFGQSEPGKELTLIFRTHFARNDGGERRSSTTESERREKSKYRIPSTITIGPCAASSPLQQGGIDFNNSRDSQDDVGTVYTLRSCLRLLESCSNMEDCRYGMERLMMIVNSELVNRKKNGSVALALVYGSDMGLQSEAERLRKVFLSCFSENTYQVYYQGMSSDSSSTSDSFENSTLTDSRRGMVDLKLPALRVLTSALELITMLENSTISSLDLSSSFWVSILGSMAELAEVVTENRIEATLSIRCIRLLYELQPNTMKPYIRYSLLPYLMHAREFGVCHGVRMLVRETERLLQPLGLDIKR